MKQRKKYSKKLSFKLPDTEAKNIFLEIATKMIGEHESIFESSFDKITIDVRGDKLGVDIVINKLRSFENRLSRATIEDNFGNYSYEHSILAEIFSPPLQLKYFSRAIQAMGFPSKIVKDTIFSPASINELRKVHKIASQVIKNLLTNENKPIRYFIAVAVIKTGIDPDTLVTMALNSSILHLAKGLMEFRVNQERAYLQMNDLIQEMDKDFKLVSIDHDKDQEFGMKELFQGGKIVFFKDGEEFDGDPLDLIEKD
jgi:hypothetical protein